jgi:citrate lyase subunit beta/citryl-CoA lyase
MTSAKSKSMRRHGEAGRRGDDVRSDLWVGVEPREKGGLELEVTSRVEAYFGQAIREQVLETLHRLGVSHARVRVEDKGALPFVIDARVETAALRAGAAGGDARPERSAPQAPPSPKGRMRRSRLYLPGNEPKYFPNAGLYAPDGVILDLEDSVHPAAKQAARLLVRNALRVVDFKNAERMVRINQLPLGLEDLAAVVPEGPEMILIPKVETADQIGDVASAIDSITGGASDDRPLWLMPILETALGIENSFEIARASERVAALTIGLEDYAADLGVPRSSEGTESMYARKHLVNAAKAAGVQAIDSVYGQVDDLEGLRSWGERSRQLGFEGMGCLHPRQIPVIHDAFNPSATQIERALRVVEAFDRAEAEGLGVVSLGSKMIDPPVVKQAMRLVEQARRLGLIPNTDEAGGDDG